MTDSSSPQHRHETVEHEGQSAVRRLLELGLSVDNVARAAQRADADALMCTDLDPTNMEGMTRWARVVRYLREELVQLGWTIDNTNNFFRVVHPEGAFAIVISSGDENVAVPGATPTTKYAKGVTTVDAVAVNSDPALFDVDDLLVVDGEVHVAELVDDGPRPVWYLLFRVDPQQIFVELSFPDRTDLDDAVDEGEVALPLRKRRVRITGWTERILLPGIDRGGFVQDLPDDEEGDEFDVAVSAR